MEEAVHSNSENAAKLVAETKSLDAEADKLRAERAYFARPFWQRTESVGFLGSILVAAFGLGGIIWTQSINGKLNDLHRQNDALTADELHLAELSAKLQPEIEKSSSERDRLRNESATLESNLTDLSARILSKTQNLEHERSEGADLRTRAAQLAVEKDRLEHNAKHFRTGPVLRWMEEVGKRNPGIFDETRLAQLIESAPQGDNADFINRCVNRTSLSGLQPDPRLGIDWYLYQATGDDYYQQDIINFAKQYFFARPSASLSNETLLSYKKNIGSYIDTRVGHTSKLDVYECERLVDSLWHEQLLDGKLLHEKSASEIDDFLFLNQCAELTNPKAYLRAVEEIQSRLLSPTNTQELDDLIVALAERAPQCYVLTWYFGPDPNAWKQTRTANIELGNANVILRGWSTLGQVGKLDEAIPIANGSVPNPKAEDWKAAHGTLIEFWVPFKYPLQDDLSKEVYYDRTAGPLFTFGAVTNGDLKF
jgi:hypothetical protein